MKLSSFFSCSEYYCIYLFFFVIVSMRMINKTPVWQQIVLLWLKAFQIIDPCVSIYKGVDFISVLILGKKFVPMRYAKQNCEGRDHQ